VVEQGFAAPNPVSSGQYVQRFSSYVWRNDNNSAPHHGNNTNHNDNTINQGEVLLQSDALTLFFPQDVTIREGQIYRYGYNIAMAIISIPVNSLSPPPKR
jgi:hypothetical protein